MSSRTAIIWWAITRVLLIAYWGLLQPGMVGDVVYYHREINDLFAHGLSESLIEYPTPVVALLLIPWLLGGGNLAAYVAIFVVAMLAIDFTFLWWLLRRGYRSAAVYWIAAVTLLGPLVYLRFDLVTAVLAGAALLVVTRRPAHAGALVGLGAAIKLWPALLAPSLWSRKRLAPVVGLFGFGGVLAVVSLAIGGWHRLISPLTWQSERGLQVESVWATLPMVERVQSSSPPTVWFSDHNAFEISAPSTAAMTSAADISMLIGLALIAVIAVLAWRSGSFSLSTAALIMVSVTSIMIVTNKTLSPQYMLWLLAPAALLHNPQADPRHIRLSWLVLILTGLTQLVYPVFYDHLVFDNADARMQLAGTVVLVLRNIGLLVATVWATVLSIRSLIDTRHEVTS